MKISHIRVAMADFSLEFSFEKSSEVKSTTVYAQPVSVAAPKALTPPKRKKVSKVKAQA